ncbi:DUF202 domain-containing protein [Cedecea colo]|uniref:DUF202 domain-containing protein n=1 Tax=Cedecea colo TaxID=2552946 RepID=UPI00143115DB
MSEELRPRDPGLQPERTALAWHRTVFTVLIFSLAAIRIAFSRGDIVSGMLSGIGAILALMLVVISYRRQKTIVADSEPTTPSSVLAKRLISAVLCLVSLSLVLPALFNLIGKGGV